MVPVVSDQAGGNHELKAPVAEIIVCFLPATAALNPFQRIDPERDEVLEFHAEFLFRLIWRSIIVTKSKHASAYRPNESSRQFVINHNQDHLQKNQTAHRIIACLHTNC